jgi:hypothetical protein
MNFDKPPQNKIENQEPLDENLKNIQEVFKFNPDLENVAFEVLGFYKDSKLELTNDTWTHATDSMDSIKNIINSGKFINKDEELDNFDKPETKGYETTVNKNAPYFRKGGLFGGYQSKKYLITTDLPDNSFQPNKNGRNEDDFDETEGIGVLKPDRRDAGNFRFWEIVNGEYVELNIPLSTDPEMEAIQLYEKYLQTIFPESKVHGVFWHHSKEKFENFDDSKIGVDDKSRAGHFFSTKRVNLSFSPNTYAVVLDIKNPDTESLEKGDSVVVPDRRYGYEVIVKSQDQIHILGSKKDIQDFKNWSEKK